MLHGVKIIGPCELKLSVGKQTFKDINILTQISKTMGLP